MPTLFIILTIVLVAGLIFFLKNLPSEEKDNRIYLEKMSHFFEGTMTPIEDNDRSYRITFRYRDYDCSYEDMEIAGLQKGSTLNVAYLKVMAKSNLSLSFTERPRTQIRSNVQTLEEATQTRWGNTQALVELPKSLSEFDAYTNDPERATKFINNAKVLKAFETYKDRDARGHPLISLKVVKGVVVLEFHAEGLKPSVLDLHHNVTTAEAYLQELIVLAEVLQSIPEKKSHQ